MHNDELDSRRGDVSHCLRVVLISNGLRPVLFRFPELDCVAVGVISWAGEMPGPMVSAVSRFELLAHWYARLRRRRFASMEHFCRRHQLLQASLLKSDAHGLDRILTEWKVDLVITSGCPMVPLSALNNVRFGGINVHPSSLPAYRGPDPLVWQLLDGVGELGVSVHQLTDRYDTGPVLAHRSIPRPRGTSRAGLLELLEGEVAVELLNQVLSTLSRNQGLEQRPQPTFSTTRTAERMPLEELAQRWSIDDLGVDTVWDIISYFGQCPPRWLALPGFHRRFKWVPVSFNYVGEHDFQRSASQWLVKRSGLRIRLLHPLAVIELRATLRV